MGLLTNQAGENIERVLVVIFMNSLRMSNPSLTRNHVKW